MNSNVLIQYIKSGLGIVPEPKQFRKLAFGPFILILFMGVFPGIMLGGFWIAISMIMVISTLIVLIAVFIFSMKPLTIKNRLIMQSLIYSNWILQILLLETMYFTMVYGFNIILFSVYMPAIGIPIFIGAKKARNLKQSSSDNFSRPAYSTVRWTLGWTGIVGAWLGSLFFQDITQNTAINVLLICLTLIALPMSFGLLSIHRLYYLRKLEQMGIVLNDSLIDEVST